MESVDQLMKRLGAAKYECVGFRGQRESNTGVISHGADIVARQVLLEWVQEYFNDTLVQEKLMSQRVEFLEEMVRKSTFAPFVADEPDPDYCTDVPKDELLRRVYEFRQGFSSALMALRSARDKVGVTSIMVYHRRADQLVGFLGGDFNHSEEEDIESQMENIGLYDGRLEATQEEQIKIYKEALYKIVDIGATNLSDGDMKDISRNALRDAEGLLGKGGGKE